MAWVCPVARVNGSAGGETMLKPVPAAVMALTITWAPPVLVRFNVCVAGFPTIAEPKSMATGLADSCAGAGVIPLPLKAIALIAVLELLVKASVAEAAPVAVGANCALNETV